MTITKVRYGYMIIAEVRCGHDYYKSKIWL